MIPSVATTPTPSVFRSRAARLAAIVLVGAGASLWHRPVGAQQTVDLSALTQSVDPVPDMEITAVLITGERLVGVLTAITPQTVSLRVDGVIRDLPRERVQRMEFDIVIVQRDGQRLAGRMISRDRDWLVMRVAGVDARIPSDAIERIELQMPLRKRYEQMRALVDDADVDRLLLVAEWLRSVQLLDDALRELDHILEVDRFNDRARNLRELVARQIEFRDRREARQRELASQPPVQTPGRAPAQAPGQTRPAPQRPAPEDDEIDDLTGPAEDDEEIIEHLERAGRQVPLGQRSDFPLLAPDQINIMKVYELDLSRPARIIIKRETITKLIEQYAGDPLIPATRAQRDAFYRRPPAEILDIMFRLQARNLYKEVQVMGEVDSMRRFRDTIQTTWLLQNCSTSGCHGDANPSGLTFYRRRSGAEQSVYTNFLILDRYRTHDDQPLIDWQTPERSLLLQMGLTRQNAYRPHPEVRGWRPVFRTAQDRRFREAVAWIESMYRPRSEIPVEYTPPGEASRHSPDEARPEPPASATPGRPAPRR